MGGTKAEELSTRRTARIYARFAGLRVSAGWAQALHQAISDRKAKIVFGGERHGGSLGCPPRAEARGDPNCRPAVKRDELNGR
jgi:hypothetical protein